MFTAINASDSRSLRKREGAVVANILKEPPVTATPTPLLENSLYSSFPGRGKTSLVIKPGTSAIKMGSIMTRTLSTLSAKTLSVFQRKKIPDFTPPETRVAVARNQVPIIIVTPAEDNLSYNPGDLMDSFPNSPPTPSHSLTAVSQLLFEETLDGMDSPIISERGHSGVMLSKCSSGLCASQCPCDIPRVKSANRHFVSNTTALWSVKHGRTYRTRHETAACKKAVDEEEAQRGSSDTLVNAENDLNFQHEHRNTGLVEQYRRRWAQLENSEDNWSVDTNPEEFSSQTCI